jgi:hypothetical protein
LDLTMTLDVKTATPWYLSTNLVTFSPNEGDRFAL